MASFRSKCKETLKNFLKEDKEKEEEAEILVICNYCGRERFATKGNNGNLTIDRCVNCYDDAIEEGYEKAKEEMRERENEVEYAERALKRLIFDHIKEIKEEKE